MAKSTVPFRGSTRPFGAYRFTSAGHEPVIALAANLMAAVSVLDRWRTASMVGEVQFNVEPGWGQQLSRGGRAHLDEAVQRCRRNSVLERYRADVGWTLTTMSDHGNDP